MRSAIISTHGHFDHILAATELKLAYEIPFMMHKKDEFLLNRMQSSVKYFTGVDTKIPPPKVDRHLVDGEILKIGNVKLKILLTPGHTPGSLSVHSETSKNIFVGDLIFKGGYFGRTDFSYSNKNGLIKSITKISGLDKHTVFIADMEKTQSWRN